MSDLKNSQTLKNIKAAFMGESMARNRYTFYEEQARKEGNEEVAAMFSKMAKNEMIHARLWFKLTEDFNDSETNLQKAAEGEHGEWKDMYPQFAEKAHEEGFDDIARLFEQVAGIEHDHELSFLKAYAEQIRRRADQGTEAVAEMETVAETEVVEAKEVQPKTVHRCMFCGAVYDKRPDVCSVCGAIGAFEAGMSN